MNKFVKKEVFIPIVSMGVFLLSIILFNNFESNQRNQMLDDYSFNYGIVNKKSTLSNGGRWLYLLHNIGGVEYSADGLDVKIDCFKKLKVGDTIFIKYSLKNPKVVEIETCYWNRKTQFEKVKN